MMIQRARKQTHSREYISPHCWLIDYSEVIPRIEVSGVSMSWTHLHTSRSTLTMQHLKLAQGHRLEKASNCDSIYPNITRNGKDYHSIYGRCRPQQIWTQPKHTHVPEHTRTLDTCKLHVSKTAPQVVLHACVHVCVGCRELSNLFYAFGGVW